MTRLTHRRAAAAAALLAALFSAPAAAQSALASRGLGYQIDPLDGRARGLGGVTVGLADPFPSLVNPASPAGLQAFAFVAAMQPDHYDATAGTAHTAGTTVRFPLLLGYLPLTQRLGLQLGYGSYLDQHWAVQQTDSITLSTGRVGVTDRFSSSGGIARFQAGAAFRATSRLALGGSVDVFTGAVHDSTVRTIPLLNPASTELVYTYSGVGFGVGARYQPSDRFSAAAAFHGGGTVHARSDSANTAAKDYTNPASVDVGASARIGGATTLVASGRWAGWSTLNDALAGSGGARDLSGVAGGLEYGGFQLAGKEVPLRLGGHYLQLPFRWAGASAFPTERAVSAGLGYGFGHGTAMFDLAAERGTRGGASAGIDEPYWRFSFSLKVLGR